MPTLTFPVVTAGLAVPVYVGRDAPVIAASVAAGLGPGPLVPAQGLLDTAADLTAIVPKVIQALGVGVAHTVLTSTAAGPVTVDVYAVSLSITDPTVPGAPTLTVPSLLATELAAPLPDADVLVGLNVLLQGKLMLDGPARRFSLEL
jgi:hypothetical protein